MSAKKRDYKAEYKKFQSSTKAKKYRAELNKYNRKKGTYGNGDGKDASHKGGKIVGFESQSKNRGRAEKSRLKKEAKLNENPAAIAAAQRMVVQAKAGKKVSVNTARQSSYAKKDPSAHNKAKSMWQRIKDRFAKKEMLEATYGQMLAKKGKKLNVVFVNGKPKVQIVDLEPVKESVVVEKLKLTKDKPKKITNHIWSAPKRILTKREWLRIPDMRKIRKNGVDYVATSIGPNRTEVFIPVVFESVNEGQKRMASTILNKFDQAYIKFSREVRDVIKMMDRSTGDKTDGKIIDKAYSKGLIPLDKLMQEWGRGQQSNPKIDEKVIKVSKKDDVPGNAMKMRGEEKIKKLTYSGSNGKGGYEIKGKNLNVIGIRPRDKGFFVRHFTNNTGFRKANLYYDGVNFMDKNKKF